MRVSNTCNSFAPFICRVGTVVLLLLSLLPLSGQETRKVLTRVAPAYPEMAKRMHVSGEVHVDATVSADGHVEKAKATSGHPMLALAAQDAVARWKFAPGSETSVVPVVVNFQATQ
jgi:TonB family protein